MEKTRVLITGGAGFIGSHIVDHHLRVGDTVAMIDDLSSGSIENIRHNLSNPRFTFHQAAIEHWDGLDRAVASADLIYHMAAVVGVKRVMENPVKVIDVNQTAVEHLLKSAVKYNDSAAILIASSSEVYSFGKHKYFSEEDDVIIPSVDRLRWCYAMTKVADEMLAFAYHYQYGLHVTTARLFNTVGKRQTGRYGMVLPHFIEQAVNNEPVTVYGSGQQSRSFCDVRDMVHMLTSLINCSDAWGEVVNVGSDHEMSIDALAELVVKSARSDSQIKHMSYRQAYGVDFQDIQHRCPNLKKLQKIIHYRAKYDIETTVNDLVAEYATV